MGNYSDMSFTDLAKRIFTVAKEHADRLGHEYFGAEHILLAILDLQQGGASKALDSAQADRALVRLHLESLVPSGDKPGNRGELPYSRSGVKVLQGAMAQAQTDGGTVVSTSHVLLGILADQSDPPIRALGLAGINIPDLASAARQNLEDT